MGGLPSTDRETYPMCVLETSVICWLLLAVQLLGLFSAWIARLSEGSSHQAISQRFFLGFLVLVGAATLVALGQGPGYWLSSGVALSVMVLVATCDFNRSQQPLPLRAQF